MYTLLILIPLSTSGIFLLRRAYRNFLVLSGNTAGPRTGQPLLLVYVAACLALGLWFIFCPVMIFLLGLLR